ncbi:MAG: hypothetical protein ACI4EF_05680 [Coprococcus sp.]
MNNGVYEKLISSEEIKGAYEGWSRYRNKVTDYIVKEIKNMQSERPVICIWGAGESNDIDLSRLAEICQLILVDRNRDALENAKKRYNLGDDIVLADVPFWHIDDDDYMMYEALLADGADEELVISHLEAIGEQNTGKIEVTDGFIADISIAIGVHSQLNSRLAAILYAYRNNYDEQELINIEKCIAALNAAAVERMNNLLYHVTSRSVVYGYELLAVYGDEEMAQEVISGLKDGKKEIIEQIHLIEGAKQLAYDISVHRDFDMEITDSIYLTWNFLFEEIKKTYVMELLTCIKKE